ncbi:M23 family metallopeptidase [Rhodoferax aquaticus]|uniref:M23 family metallopeptidase n=1 Tax=Rhodoferax aquaticus TaxID=2527691 RepID=A0A515EUQ2_9BURK|nr:M23 family metallopeptidase [Rhodoferax aquaticus]QDL56417.1 M23 family metallopeptidase [Rhodoferax aquaticus]
MLISPPFLKSGTPQDNNPNIQLAFTGQYPVTSHLEWHNGQHLIAPQENSSYVEVRAIADGKVIYLSPPDAQPSSDKDHPQNYAAFGSGPEWTDKGMLILEHTTEIGASGNTPTAITYYSVYAHLSAINKSLKAGDKVYRKDSLGKPGHIYAQPGHMHFEICLNDDNLKKLLGQDPSTWPNADAAPSKDGRTDAVFGSTYIYLPQSTPVQSTVPTQHLQSAAAQTLGTAQWVQISYAGNATLTSYTVQGAPIGSPRSDTEAEYKLYQEANTRHNSLPAADKASSSPSGWYELLRFGRNLGWGDAATDKDPLPTNAAHWRKIVTPAGEVWADLNATGSYKFSDADFPSVLGWNCIGDDTRTTDQRCDSAKLKTLLTSEIEGAQAKQEARAKPTRLFEQTSKAAIAHKLRKAICKFPTEFDQGDFEARYGHIKEEDYFKSDATGENWKKLSAHIKALTMTDLPQAYKDAQWHLHPLEFIEQMRRCGWLSKSEFTQLLPSYAVRSGQWKDTQGGRHPGVFWEKVNVSDQNLESGLIANHRIPMNRTLRKYGIHTPLRMASFFGNAVQESNWLSSLQENAGSSLWYEPWFGRGFLQLTSPGNYFAYWRWRGRKLDVALDTQLKNTYDDMYKNTAKRAQKLLDDAYFPQVTQEIKDWRSQVNGGARSELPEEKLAPSDSAGFYWAALMIKHADGQHVLERRSVAIVDSNGQSKGDKVYYRSPTFWKVSASVNLPGAVDNINYAGINGFDARCSAYGVALAVLTEMRFASGTGIALDYPEGYIPRRAQ